MPTNIQVSRFVFVALLCGLLSGCLSTTAFKAYDDGGATYLGRGGAKEIVDGVELWSDGSPPRQYRLIGMIEDSRPNAVIPKAAFKSDMVKAVREHGGEAGIILSRGVVQLGSYTMPTGVATHTGTATPMGNGQYRVQSQSSPAPSITINQSAQTTTVAVIRYVNP